MAHTLFFAPHAHTSSELQASLTNNTAAALLTLPTSTPPAYTTTQAAQSLTRLTLKIGDDETTLSESLLLVSVHRDRLLIMVQSLSGDAEAAAFAASVSVQSLLQGLLAEGSSAKSGRVSQLRAVTLAIYSKAGSGLDSSEASMLVGLEVGQGESEGVFVCKVPLEDIDFTEVATNATDNGTSVFSEATLSSIPSQALPEEFKSRKIGLKTICSLCATGERGVALAADASGKVVVLDVEGEEDEDSEDDGSDAEETGDRGEEGSESESSMDQTK